PSAVLHTLSLHDALPISAWSGEVPAILVNIQRQPGANVIEVVDHVHALLPQLRAAMPDAVDVTVLSDRTESIRASIKGVQHELLDRKSTRLNSSHVKISY